MCAEMLYTIKFYIKSLEILESVYLVGFVSWNLDISIPCTLRICMCDGMKKGGRFQGKIMCINVKQ